jgi:hypothetical protein
MTDMSKFTQYSPDRRWFWNGEKWLRVSETQLIREASARERSRQVSTSSSTILWLALVGVGALIVLPVAYLLLRLMA